MIGNRFVGREQELSLFDAQVFFVGFSRSGWTDAAQAYAAELQDRPPAGRNWTCAGMRLLDLTQVDDDLTAWSE